MNNFTPGFSAEKSSMTSQLTMYETIIAAA